MTEKIELVETRISPDILDTIGNSFKFRHGGGIAEWLKNSLDNYLRRSYLGEETRNGNWPVLINLIDGKNQSTGPNLAVIDFGGATLKDIEQFLLYWGDRTAATHGNKTGGALVTGGHGNGGKFYMRQMWRRGARFLTWQRGRASSLVVERRSDGNSGYWEFKDQRITWKAALDRALSETDNLGGAEALIENLETSDPALVGELDSGGPGLTAVVGRIARQVHSSNDVVRGGRWDQQKLVDSVRDAAQARRPIRELSITVMANGRPIVGRLSPEVIEDDPSWTIGTDSVPATLLRDKQFSASGPSLGTMRIRKAALPLSGRLKHFNSLWVLDAVSNPIASYQIKELPIPGYSSLLDFIHAELELDFAGMDGLVENEREKLVRSTTTQALLEWVAATIWERVQELERTQRESARRTDLEIASILNDQLNLHAKQFLEELQTEILVDLVQDPGGGGPGPRGGPGSGEGGSGEGGKTGPGDVSGGQTSGGPGDSGTSEVPGTSEQVRRPRFPQVLLSGFDPDPSTGGSGTRNLTERHPPLEQNDMDKKYNVWWINTQHAFAKLTLQHGGSKGAAFKSYQLHMFRDVVQREVLRYRQRRESELSLDVVENELTDISNRFLAALPRDLAETLLD
jgi:hypothetical protein